MCRLRIHHQHEGRDRKHQPAGFIGQCLGKTFTSRAQRHEDRFPVSARVRCSPDLALGDVGKPTAWAWSFRKSVYHSCGSGSRERP